MCRSVSLCCSPPVLNGFFGRVVRVGGQELPRGKTVRVERGVRVLFLFLCVFLFFPLFALFFCFVCFVCRVFVCCCRACAWFGLVWFFSCFFAGSCAPSLSIELCFLLRIPFHLIFALSASFRNDCLAAKHASGTRLVPLLWASSPPNPEGNEKKEKEENESCRDTKPLLGR